MESPDAMNNLEDSNIDIEVNELGDASDEVNGNYFENASGGGEPTVKKKRTIFPSFVGLIF
ncbi:hypothetical protein KY285_007933 [Solanum tuberosum]|nr:hypothetical protein KY285_007933 [Solanum tuberosum]